MKTLALFRTLLTKLYRNHYARLGEDPTPEQMLEAMQLELNGFEKSQVVEMFSEYLIVDGASEELEKISDELSQEFEKELLEAQSKK